MDRQQHIADIAERIQVLADNIADAFDTINFHSRREATGDLHRRVFPNVDRMMRLIRDLMHNMPGDTPAAGELREMYELLDITRKCSVEYESFSQFMDAMIPLLDRLSAWAVDGPPTGDVFTMEDQL